MRGSIMVLALGWSVAAVEISPRSAGLFFDAGGEEQFVKIEPYQNRTLRLIAFQFEELSAWESQLGFSDPSLSVLGTRLHPGSALNSGSVANWFVDLGQCIQVEATATLLEVDFTAFAQVAPNSVVCLAPAMPTSVFPPWPAYRDCDGVAESIHFDLRHPQLLFEACAGINFPELVSGASSSFGALKGRY